MLKRNDLELGGAHEAMVDRLLTGLYPPTLEDVRKQRRKRLHRLPWDKANEGLGYFEAAAVAPVAQYSKSGRVYHARADAVVPLQVPAP